MEAIIVMLLIVIVTGLRPNLFKAYDRLAVAAFRAFIKPALVLFAIFAVLVGAMYLKAHNERTAHAESERFRQHIITTTPVLPSVGELRRKAETAEQIKRIQARQAEERQADSELITRIQTRYLENQ